MTSRRANALTVVGLIGLLALTSLTAPRWARLLQRPLPTPAEEGGAAEARPREEGAPAAARSTINVKLFFQAADRPGLMIEERTVAHSADLSRQIKAVVEELIAGSKNGLGPTLAPATRVLEVFVTVRGVAYVNLSKEATQGPAAAAASGATAAPGATAAAAAVAPVPSGGSEAELITVYSVVNSLTVNFPAIKRVQILVEDKPRPTLWGHVDLTRPLPPDMTLLATSTLTPVANP
jgi:spore germination protein GerM